MFLFYRKWVFELWVENEKLLGNLSLAGSIAAFVHLAFVFGLSYNSDVPTMSDILQRKFAEYGDDSGFNIILLYCLIIN